MSTVSLMMFSNEIRKIPLDKVIPFNHDDLIIAPSKDVFFQMVQLGDDRGVPLYIKELMLKEDVFNCDSFEERCAEFGTIMDARLERFFETKKCTYLFFDKEEQNVIKKYLMTNTLTCHIKIYLRQEDDSFKYVDFESELTPAQFRTVKTHMKKLRIKCVVEPDSYFRVMYEKNKQAKDKMTAMRNRFDNMDSFKEQYPKLKETTTQEQVKDFYKRLCKKYHPDKNSNPDANDVFVKINTDFEVIMNGDWFSKLQKEDSVVEEVSDKVKSIFARFTS